MTKYFAFIVTVFTLTSIITLFTIQSMNTKSPQIACMSQDFSGVYNHKANIAHYHDNKINIPKELAKIPQDPNVLGTSSPSEKWIEISLKDQTIKAWDGQKLYLEDKISSGDQTFPTPKGEFHIWSKLRYADVKGGVGSSKYDLPNVPFTMFFEGVSAPAWKGYALHGSYWLNNFGTTNGNGCVNLQISTAQKLFYWITPDLVSDQNFARSSDTDPGTKIIIHE